MVRDVLGASFYLQAEILHIPIAVGCPLQYLNAVINALCQTNKFIPRENDKNYPALVS